MASIERTLDPGTSYFSAAEIRIAVVPIGKIPPNVFQKYGSLVIAHRQVELSNVRSFYKESQKSPFKFFPWKTGLMHFRFLPEKEAKRFSPLSNLHSHRRIFGLIGLTSCHHASESTLEEEYAEFEAKCRSFPDASTVRLLAFDPKEAHIMNHDQKKRPDLVLFPPGTDEEHLVLHTEVVMHDFAACVLGNLETFMLNASPAAISLATLVDSYEFTSNSTPPYVAEDESGRKKRKYARLQKILGDYSLLAGSPLDALDHYNTASEIGRTSNDWTFAAASMEGYATAKLLHGSVEQDAFATNTSSVFRNEKAWRKSSAESGHSQDPSEHPATKKEGSKSDVTQGMKGEDDKAVEQDNLLVPDKADNETLEQAEVDNHGLSTGDSCFDPSLRDNTTGSVSPRESTSTKSRTMGIWILEEGIDATPEHSVGSAFSTELFKLALQRASTANGLEEEIRTLVEESRSALRKRGGLPLILELDIRFARFLALIHGSTARVEASRLVSGLQVSAEMLPLPEDRLIALTEAAEILGDVGSLRKRMMLMWQAVELSRYFKFPDARTLAVARRALRPMGASPQNTMLSSWSLVQAGCLEATLGLAIYAKRHADVFDTASALLKEHSSELSTHRMQSLLDNILAASSQMTEAEKQFRSNGGPPPLVHNPKPMELKYDMKPMLFNVDLDTEETSTDNSKYGVFLYDPFSEKRTRGMTDVQGAKTLTPPKCEWVVGELGFVEIEVSNPTSVSIKVEKLTLEAEFKPSGTSEKAGWVSATRKFWKPKPVSLNIPGNTKPVKIRLEGIPLAPGSLRLIGCRLTAFSGISWNQQWAPHSLRLQEAFQSFDARSTSYDSALATSSLDSNASYLPSIPTSPPEVQVSDALPIASLALAPQRKSCDHNADDYLKFLRNKNRSKESGKTMLQRRRSYELDLASLEIKYQKTCVQLFQGQILQAVLTITNQGQIDVDKISIYSSNISNSMASKRNSPSKESFLNLAIDINEINKSLPLGPGKSISLEMEITVENTHIQSSASNFIFHELVQLEYGSNVENSSHGNAGKKQIKGRYTALLLEVNATPALTLSNLHIYEISELSGNECKMHDEISELGDNFDKSVQIDKDKDSNSEATESTLPKASRKSEVAIRADVINHSDLPIKAWLVFDSLSLPMNQNNYIIESRGLLLDPGQKENLKIVLNTQALDYIKSLDSQMALSDYQATSIQAPEDMERCACAMWLSASISFYFVASDLSNVNQYELLQEQQMEDISGNTASSPGENASKCFVPSFGRLVIAESGFFQALSLPILGFLRHATATVKVKVEKLRSSIRPECEIKRVVNSMGHVIPVECAHNGDTIVLCLELGNCTEVPIEMKFSVDCFPEFSDNESENKIPSSQHYLASDITPLQKNGRLISATPGAFIGHHLLEGGRFPTSINGHNLLSAKCGVDLMSLTSAWTGQHKNILYKLGPHETKIHKLALTFVREGLFWIGLSNVVCTGIHTQGVGQKERQWVVKNLVEMHRLFVCVDK